MDNARESLKLKIIDVVCGVTSEELGFPREEISANMKIPLNKKGLMISMRMANAIPGGGLIHITPTDDSILCTVDELAEKCTEEMIRVLRLLKNSKSK